MSPDDKVVNAAYALLSSLTAANKADVDYAWQAMKDIANNLSLAAEDRNTAMQITAFLRMQHRKY